MLTGALELDHGVAGHDVRKVQFAADDLSDLPRHASRHAEPQALIPADKREVQVPVVDRLELDGINPCAAWQYSDPSVVQTSGLNPCFAALQTNGSTDFRATIAIPANKLAFDASFAAARCSVAAV